MTAVPDRAESIRVPREDGRLLVRPSLAEAVSIARAGLAETTDNDVRFGSMSLAELRERARTEVVAAAVRETELLVGESIAAPSNGPIVVTGHQPEPFHPGVWIKNVAVDALAREVGGVGLNVVVDTDVYESSAMRLPAGDRERPRTETIAFDAEQPSGPWEEATVVDPDLWTTFPDRLRAALEPWGIDPGVVPHWRPAEGSLAAATTGVRVRAERAAGVANLEVSLSRVEETDAFRRFALHLLRDAERFHTIHEDVLAAYRRRKGLRSRTHPVPSLEVREGWIETPFRTWRTGERTRRPVFVRRRQDWLRVSDGGEDFAVLPADDELAVAELRSLADSGIRVRTRALTTTMFLRLFLADLFVHGVGGAKYDELTDEIIARFVGLPAPPFLLLSGTRHLPLGGPFDVNAEDVRQLERTLRDLRYNADRHLRDPLDPEVEGLVREKRELVEAQRAAAAGGTQQERRARAPENRRRWERLQSVNAALASHAAGLRAETESELANARRRLEANTILTGREWSWWAYPSDRTLPWMQEAITSDLAKG